VNANVLGGSMIKKIAIVIGIFMLYFGVSRGLPLKPKEKERNLPTLETVTMIAARSDGVRIPFTVMLARTPKDQERGLMFVQSLPENEGMAFLYTPPQKASFWMKNTYIPLDLLFISPGGQIESIKRNAKPRDLTPIRSLGPVEAVVEINGGLADKYGIKEGDKVGVVSKTAQ